MIDRRLFREIDWFLIAIILFISLLGVIFIFSSSHTLSGKYFLRQLVWIAAGIIVMIMVAAVDYKYLLTYSPVFYVLTLLVLLSLLFWAELIANTRSWFRTGLFQIQPSEIAKVVMILVSAKLFSSYRDHYLSSRKAVITLLIFLLPVILILLQPDLGMALMFLPIIGGTFILAGLKKKSVVVFLVVTLALSAGGWNYVLKDYQKKRFLTLLNPHQDARGSGYQVIQSKIAIGSGGFSGKGFMKGTQSQLRFLPARHTDFIFSVAGEEFGFLGIFVLMFLYFLLIARIFASIPLARDRAAVYIVFLAGLLLAFQSMINIMMVIGLFPVTGTTLPFLSYGGSSTISFYAVCGLVLNVRMRRFANV